MAGERRLLLELKKGEVSLADAFNKRTELHIETQNEDGGVAEQVDLTLEPYEIDILIKALTYMKQGFA